MWRRLKPLLKPDSVAVRVIPSTAVMAAGTVIAVLGYQQLRDQPQQLPRLPAGRADHVVARSTSPTSSPSATAPTTSPRSSTPTAAPTARSPGAAWSHWLTGIAAELPFIAQPDYTGPLVARLGGADISWIIGFIVPAAVYLLLTRRTRKAGHPGHLAAAPIA